jgi:hypothetical protein
VANDSPEPHVHVCADAEVARVLVDAFGRFANAGVIDELNFRSSGSMLKDIVYNAVAFDQRASIMLDRWSSRSEADRDGSYSQERHDRTHDGRLKEAIAAVADLAGGGLL